MAQSLDERELERRLEVSRRLKAARWLAGDVDENGRPSPLSPEELARRQPLVRNRISANAVMEIEQLRKPAREMELQVIARALGLPEAWFSEPIVRSSGAMLHLPDVHFQAAVHDAVADHIEPLAAKLAALSNLLLLDLETHRQLSPEVRSVVEAIKGADASRSEITDGGGPRREAGAEPQARSDPPRSDRAP